MSETPHFITKEAIEKLVNLTKSEFNKASQGMTITLSTTWTYANGYYTQSVVVTGMKATDIPTLDVESSVDNADEVNSEWSKVFHAETYDGCIKFYAKSATTINLTVLVKPEISKVNINELSSEEFAKQVIVNAIYPVGSIYMSVNDVSPSTLFGGTWEKVSQGRAIFGSGSLNGITYKANETINAGLPNIEGTINRRYGESAFDDAYSGAFSGTSGSTKIMSTNWSTGNEYAAKFDASKYNSIYGNSKTVQPNAYVVNVYKRTA